MCGILYINSKTENLDKNLCLRAFKTLKSRGPDKQLYEFLDKKIFRKFNFKHNRKSKKGFKLYGNSKFKLLFNGEIYNYKSLQSKFGFNSNQISSDTDLLLKLNIKKVLQFQQKI